MKKISLFLVLMVSLGTLGFAQGGDIDNREKLQFGAKAGFSYSNIYDSKNEQFNADAKFGFTGGLFLSIPIGKYLGLHPEFNFTQKGFTGNGVILGEIYTVKRTTDYFEIPLLLELKPSEFLTLLVGPQYSYLTRQRDEFTSSIVNIDQVQEFEQDNIRKNVLGFVVGLDINLRRLVLGGRVGWDVQNNGGNGTSAIPRYKNICTQVTIGLRI